MEQIRQISLDGGVTYTREHAKIIWGLYFFYAEEMNLHQREMQNIFNILSDFGGLVEILVYSVGLVIMAIN